MSLGPEAKDFVTQSTAGSMSMVLVFSLPLESWENAIEVDASNDASNEAGGLMLKPIHS